MENSILYTFSTIAQALGGAFALLSAFVLFRFQSLDASMLNASVGLRCIWKSKADLESYDTLRGLSIWPSLNKAIEAQIARMIAVHETPSFEVMATKTRLKAGESLHSFFEQHELVVKGPYRIVRHPIYTGLILAVAGTGLALDKGIGFFMALLVFASYWLKMRVEEKLMMETFPEEYPEYRRRVKALIPGIL
jgi:hypothetical protein